MTIHHRTPVFRKDSLRKAPGKSLHLKMECFQPAGSFKIRGVGLLSQVAVTAGAKTLISSSGGNAGYAVAYAGHALGVDIIVVVPTTTPETVRQKIEALGAKVVVHGSVWDEAHAHALDLAKSGSTYYIPPFDHPTLWTGHASMMDEIAADCEKPDAVVLSVGGGGLLCGVVEGLHRNGWHDVPVIAVETEGAASFYSSVLANRLITLDEIKTVATSLGAKQVAAQALEWTQKHTIIPHLVSDQAAVRACLSFADDFRVLVEPACGASLSLAYDNVSVIQDYRSLLIIVCGGIGADLQKFSQWKRDYLV